MLEVRNSQVAKEFYEIADIMEIKGLNPFRIRAYRNAARTVENLSQPVLDMVKLGTKLDDLPGIGKDLAGKIIYTAKTGQFPAKREIERGAPHGLLSLLRIPSLGPKRVSVLYKTLHVRSLKDLERCCQQGLVQGLHGFGEKMEKRLLMEVGK